MQRAHPFQATQRPSAWIWAMGNCGSCVPALRPRCRLQGGPALVILAKRMLPLGVSRSSRSIAGQPCAAQESPSIAFSGASALGPLRSSTVWGLASKHPLDRQRQTARRGKGRSRGIGQPRLNHDRWSPAFSGHRGPRLHAGGNFFGEQFNQQIRHLVHILRCAWGILRRRSCRHRLFRRNRSVRARHSRARHR